MKTRYFVTAATRHTPTRYHILQGRTVVHTQASRPDGTEVPQPTDVRFGRKTAQKATPDCLKYEAFRIAGSRNSINSEEAQRKRERGGAARKRMSRNWS